MGPPHWQEMLLCRKPRLLVFYMVPSLASGSAAQPGCLNAAQGDSYANVQHEGAAPKPKTGSCCFPVSLLREGSKLPKADKRRDRKARSSGSQNSFL